MRAHEDSSHASFQNRSGIQHSKSCDQNLLRIYSNIRINIYSSDNKWHGLNVSISRKTRLIFKFKRLNVIKKYGKQLAMKAFGKLKKALLKIKWKLKTIRPISKYIFVVLVEIWIPHFWHSSFLVFCIWVAKKWVLGCSRKKTQVDFFDLFKNFILNF